MPPDWKETHPTCASDERLQHRYGERQPPNGEVTLFKTLLIGGAGEDDATGMDDGQRRNGCSGSDVMSRRLHSVCPCRRTGRCGEWI